MTDERKKILDKAKKLNELAERGVGGEKDNAISMLAAWKEKHSISEEELELHKLDDDAFSGMTKEQFYAVMTEDFARLGLYFLAAATIGFMKHWLNVNDMRRKQAAAKPIQWEYNKKSFSFRGFIGADCFFDIQQTRDGALLYKAGLMLEKELPFNSVDTAKQYCENIKQQVITKP